MSSPYFHSAAKARLDQLTEDLPQSLIVSGPEGVGLSGAIDYLAGKLDITPHVILPEKNEVIDTEAGTISVDSIRRLYDLTKTIESGRRLVVIDYAEKMGHQAQNAFLKLLEEPGVNTHFILLTHRPSRLLPTVRSRAQHFDVRPITDNQSDDLLNELGVKDPQKRTQLLFIASGLPAELTRLSVDDEYFEKRAQIVRDARLYLQGSAYDKLKLSQNYKDDRLKALLLLNDAMKMLQASVGEQKSSANLKKLNVLLDIYEKVEANGNIRLQLAAGVV